MHIIPLKMLYAAADEASQLGLFSGQVLEALVSEKLPISSLIDLINEEASRLPFFGAPDSLFRKLFEERLYRIQKLMDGVDRTVFS